MAKEYIEREALLSAFGEEPMVWDERDDAEVQERFDWQIYTGIVEVQPAADVAEVVHGRWVDYMVRDWRCSVCGEKIAKVRNVDGYCYEDKPHYCPNCGARMDGEK